jgi:hypothetical protein
VIITYIRTIRSTCFDVVPVSSIGYVVGFEWLGAVAVTVWVRSQVEAISFNITHTKAIPIDSDSHPDFHSGIPKYKGHTDKPRPVNTLII